MSSSKTWVIAESTVVYQAPDGTHQLGDGHSKRLQTGRSGDRDHKSYLKFTLDWSGIGKIISATLVLRTSDSTPAAASKAYVSRLTSAAVFGTNADGVFDATDFTAPKATTSGMVSSAMDRTTDGTTSINITAIVNQWAPKSVKQSSGAPGPAAANYGLRLHGSSLTTEAWEGWSKYADDPLTKPTIVVIHDLGPTIPNAPTNVYPNAIGGFDFTSFQGDFSDTRSTDTLNYAEVEVYDAGHAGTAATTDIFTSTAHGLHAKDVIYFTSLTGGVGVSTFKPYFVSATGLTANTFKLTTSLGGAGVDVTTAYSALTWSVRVFTQKQKSSASEITAQRFNFVPTGFDPKTNITYRWRSRVTDQENQVSPWTGLTSFRTTTYTPGTPNAMKPVNASSFDTLNGVDFTAKDIDTSRGLLAYQIQMAPGSGPDDSFPDLNVWDTGKVFVPSGTTNITKTYGGRSLNSGTYGWRMRFWNTDDIPGAWASLSLTLTASFTADPTAADRVQVKPQAPWRILIKDIATDPDPSIALVGDSSAGAAPHVLHTQFITTAPTTLNDPPTSGNLIVLVVYRRGGGDLTPSGGGWTTIKNNGGSVDSLICSIYAKISNGTETTIDIPLNQLYLKLMYYEITGAGVADIQNLVVHNAESYPDVLYPDVFFGPGNIVKVGLNTNLFLMGAAVNCDGCGPTYHDTPTGWVVDELEPAPGGSPATLFEHRLADASESPQFKYTVAPGNPAFLNAEAWGLAIGGSSAFTPTPGNLLLLALTKDTGIPVLPAGFETVALVRTAKTGTIRYMRVCKRTAQAGDTFGGLVNMANYRQAYMQDWHAVYKSFRASSSHATTTAFLAGGAFTPTPHVPAALVGFGAIGSTGTAAHVTPTAGVVEDLDSFDTSNPTLWAGHKIVTNPTTAYSVGGTISASKPYGGVTVILGPVKVAKRGPNKIVAILEDAEKVGASTMYNSPGDLHFTLPNDHPQISVIEPKQVHYAVEQYLGDGWKEIYAGLIWDADMTETDTIFYGLDYLGLFDYVQDERVRPGALETSYLKGGSKYTDVTISTVVTNLLQYAIGLQNSLVNFISLGAIGTMSEHVTTYSTYEHILQFVSGLIDSHRQGQGHHTRIYVAKVNGVYTLKVDENPGATRSNLVMRYGENVEGFRVIPFGTSWADHINGIARRRDGLKVYYRGADAPGIHQGTYGHIAQEQLFDGVSDDNDLKRRVQQAAIHAGKLGKNIGLGITTQFFRPFDGYNITDGIPVEIIFKDVDTTKYGSGIWVVYGIAWEPGGAGEGDNLTLTIMPREDATSPSDDLIPSVPISTQAEWQQGFVAPDPLVSTSKFHIDINTGIIYIRNEDGDWSDASDGATGSYLEDEV